MIVVATGAKSSASLAVAVTAVVALAVSTPPSAPNVQAIQSAAPSLARGGPTLIQASGRAPLPFRSPVDDARAQMGSGFGMRHHPLLNATRSHFGVDWTAPPGTPVLAVEGGAVAQIEYAGEFGRRIAIEHAKGTATSYSHLQRFAEGLKLGDVVQPGQLIGFVGSTGLSASPHLHFELWIDGKVVDPLDGANWTWREPAVEK